MQLKELYDLYEGEDTIVDGVYVGVRFTDETVDSLVDFAKDHNINDIQPKASLHTTVLYSRVDIRDQINLRTDMDPPLVGEFEKFDIWKSSSGTKNILVLIYKCPELEDRHEEFIKLGGTHDFPDYIPHISLSYDLGEIANKSKFIKKLGKYSGPIEIYKEYIEDLTE